MARAGLCSRRDAEAWILEGRVIVNGETLLTPARDIVPSDRVEVDGKPLPLRERTRLFLYHKSRGLVTTARDPEGRPTVFAQLPKGLPRLISVGRLDINTEGLLLLTNDGGLARIIELPDTGWLRRYRVRCFGEIDQSTLDSLRDGVTIDDMHYGPIEATLDREKGDNVWLTLGLREGKNREVKRVLEHFGLAVNRLIRVSFGPFQLGELAEGAVEEVRTGFLRHQISPEMVTASGVDFDGPIFNYDEEFEDIAPKKFERRDERPRDARGSDRREQSRGPRRDDDRGPRRDDDRGPRRSFDRDDRASPRGDRPDRPSRFEARTPDAGADEKPARPLRPHRNEVQKKIWRADDVQEKAATRSTPKAPRRGFDPKKARAENAERTHERAGRIQTRSGKSITVEKLAPRTRSESGRDSRPSQGKGAPRSKGPRPPRGR
jgi:23S rRNA pseudouridine2605 synthase